VAAFLSMILDNVTTVVLLAPLTILIAEVLGISAIPLLMAEAILSNVGGVATLIGDPPNILIASASGLSFNDFLSHSLPVVLLIIPLVLGLVLVVFRRMLAKTKGTTQALLGFRPEDAWNDRTTARRVVIVLGAALLLFLLQDALSLTPAFIALSMAAVALVWTQPSVDEFLKRIDWQVLLFFAALFVIVGGLEASGVLELLAAGLAARLDGSGPAAAVTVLWLTAVAAALVDNVPITAAMIPIILGLGERGINVAPLWWALAFGVGFGGNGTIIGSTAGILVAEISSKTPNPITSRTWLRLGPQALIVACLIATLALVVAYPYFAR
jgi:Na+/H+ antiporter NhaD/arsenite permease-like protein